MADLFDLEVGPIIQAETGVDLSGASKVAIKATNPSGTGVELAGSASGTKVQHTKTASTLNVVGPWVLQAYAEIGANKYWGDEANLEVKAAIP